MQAHRDKARTRCPELGARHNRIVRLGEREETDSTDLEPLCSHDDALAHAREIHITTGTLLGCMLDKDIYMLAWGLSHLP
jgi:hypothetical protein